MPYLEREGMRLFYEEAGRGGPPLLLVHGWCGNHRHLAPQFEYFRSTRRVVAVDRRGHGQSDAPEQEYTIQGFADDLAWMCEELGLYQPIAVVHSQGVIGLDVAMRYPELLGGLVLLDVPLFPPPPIVELFEGLLQSVRSPAYRNMLRQAADQIAFAPGVRTAAQQQLLEAMTNVPQHVIVSTWEHFLTYDPAPALAACRIPVLTMGSFFPSDLGRAGELCPQLTAGQVVGAGHFAQMEVPAQVNAMIERFLETAVSPEAAVAGAL